MSVGVVLLIVMISPMVSHWMTARAFAMLMRIAKELNTGPGIVGIVIGRVLNAQIWIRPQRTPIQWTPVSPRLFTKKITVRHEERTW